MSIDRSNYKRQFSQTSNESGDASDAKVKCSNHLYSGYNNFQRGGRGGYNQGRGGYNQGRGYHGNSSSFRGGYNQRGYYGGGRSVRGNIKIFLTILF